MIQLMNQSAIIEAYPLTWPIGYKRTDKHRRKDSRFQQTPEAAQTFLRTEVSRLPGKNLIVSTNIPLRKDGYLYADMMKSKIDDPGAAIYFEYKAKQISMCCDQYERPWENIYALGKGIESLRGMDRWGVSDFLERAFTGFAALPEVITLNQKSIWQILGLNEKPGSAIIVHQAYKQQSKKVHPDTGGSVEAFHELQVAYEQALSHFNIVTNVQ